ncbi:hydroxyacid dehydrogenase [Saccharobesus litoralis]|uniref:Hydroxyacid dehydrogenase n=1 Tax=Saccharobesus litoralis TaxID=2172099 RepID=A0A2S0VU26_9ALTE|nr:2-hydroxyacid dehydrogenase [Saccharobesus litoralis]AWB67709.1 hydroxyacid dehydrogenase [Saccharobesus litoralis]
MFKVAVFSSKSYDKKFLSRYEKQYGICLDFFEHRLTTGSVQLAQGYDAICVFVNDELNSQVLTQLASYNIRTIALRCAGYNNVDITTAAKLKFSIARVPEYSPQAVAEHAVGLMLTLSRKFHKAYNRVKEDNFALDGLLGFNLYQKTVGVIGTGHIGKALCQILQGFSCQIIAYDPTPNTDLITTGVQYKPLDTVLNQADIISLHCPLTPTTQHLINEDTIAKMKNDVMLINTSRGGLIDTHAIISALKNQRIGYLGLDVYELESELFFEDKSDEIIQDDDFQRLLTFPNVMITGHQGFFTQEALDTIASTTLDNLSLLLNKQPCHNLCQLLK